jgi:hypothetical protein
VLADPALPGPGGLLILGAEASPWLTDALTDFDRRAIAGEIWRCRHLAPGQVGVVALWAPDRVICGDVRCEDFPALSDDANNTCDRCGVVSSGLRAIRSDPLVLRAGATPIRLKYGLCPDCLLSEFGPDSLWFRG